MEDVQGEWTGPNLKLELVLSKECSCQWFLGLFELLFGIYEANYWQD
jgi:hypothetical protein